MKLIAKFCESLPFLLGDSLLLSPKSLKGPWLSQRLRTFVVEEWNLNNSILPVLPTLAKFNGYIWCHYSSPQYDWIHSLFFHFAIDVIAMPLAFTDVWALSTCYTTTWPSSFGCFYVLFPTSFSPDFNKKEWTVCGGFAP